MTARNAMSVPRRPLSFDPVRDAQLRRDLAQSSDDSREAGLLFSDRRHGVRQLPQSVREVLVECARSGGGVRLAEHLTSKHSVGLGFGHFSLLALHGFVARYVAGALASLRQVQRKRGFRRSAVSSPRASGTQGGAA